MSEYSADRISVLKGLGEMDAEQLWATTMDPQRRTLLRGNIEDAARADELLVLAHGQPDRPTPRVDRHQRPLPRERGRLS